jgi:hypothetical protein
MDCLAIASPGCQLYSLNFLGEEPQPYMHVSDLFIHKLEKKPGLSSTLPLHFLSCTCQDQDFLWWRQNHTTGQIWELYLGSFSVFHMIDWFFFFKDDLPWFLMKSYIWPFLGCILGSTICALNVDLICFLKNKFLRITMKPPIFKLINYRRKIKWTGGRRRRMKSHWRDSH